MFQKWSWLLAEVHVYFCFSCNPRRRSRTRCSPHWTQFSETLWRHPAQLEKGKLNCIKNYNLVRQLLFSNSLCKVVKYVLLPWNNTTLQIIILKYIKVFKEVQLFHYDPATLITEFSASVKKHYQDLINLEREVSKPRGCMWKWLTLFQLNINLGWSKDYLNLCS